MGKIIRTELGSIFSNEDLAQITALLKNKDFSGWFHNNEGGPYLNNFQKQFADFCGVKHAFAVNSGSSAIYIALKACGIGQGDIVAVPAYTHIGSVAPIILAGAEPLFIDVDKYGNIDPLSLQEAEAYGAVIVVHQLGMPCDIFNIKNVSGDAFIIEDASHALGSTYYGMKAGVLGEIGCFSIGGGRTKTICVGEGGMIVTNIDELATKCKNMRNHGDRNFDADYFCFNFRMSDLKALIGLVQMSNLQTLIDWQIKNAEYLIKNLPNYLEVFPAPPHVKTVRYLIGCHFNQEKAGMTRNQFINKMKEQGYQQGPRYFIGGGYSKLISDVKFYTRYGHTDLSMSKKLLKESVWIDFHRFPRTKEEIKRLLEDLK